MTTTLEPATVTSTRTWTARRILLGIAVAAAAILQLVAMLLHPPLAPDGAGQLAIVAADPVLWFVAHVIAGAAGAAFIVAALALAGLVRARGSALATVGAVLVVLGGATIAIAFGAEAHLLSTAADPSLDRAAMGALAELERSSPAVPLLFVGLSLEGLGQILLMVGLLRSRAVRWWWPTLVLVGLVASFAGTPGSAIGPVLWAPAVLGYLALAAVLARSPS